MAGLAVTAVVPHQRISSWPSPSHAGIQAVSQQRGVVSVSTSPVNKSFLKIGSRESGEQKRITISISSM